MWSVRQRVLEALRARTMEAGELAREVGIQPSRLSYHLNRLKEAELVTAAWCTAAGGMPGGTYADDAEDSGGVMMTGNGVDRTRRKQEPQDADPGQEARRRGVVLLAVHIVIWALAVLPLAVSAMVLPAMPGRIPVHWSAAGAIDRWGSKWESLILPVFCVLFAAAWVLSAWLAFRRRQSGKKVYLFGGIVALIVFNGMHAAFLCEACQQGRQVAAIPLDGVRAVYLAIGIGFVILGNLMPKIKPNHVFGVRIGYAYLSREMWRRCQRAGGIAFIVGGLAILACAVAFDGIVLTLAFLIVLVMMIAGICLYGSIAARRYATVGGPVLDENGDIIDDD